MGNSGTDHRAKTPALQAAQQEQQQGGIAGFATDLVEKVLDVGIDGRGPFASAMQIAQDAQASTASPKKAVDAIVRRHLAEGAIGGFVTGLGGFVTMPIALPVNVFEFYVQATRMVGAIAHLRGYDVNQPRIRTAVLLTLIGSSADDVLAKAGLSTGGGRLTSLALKRLPPAALLVINKGVGFRLLRGVGEKVLAKLGRGIPLAGGVVGAGLDGYLMKKIADQASHEFPPVDAG